MYCEKRFSDGDFDGKYHYSFEPMKRMYVRVSNTIDDKRIRKYVPIGWICPICKEIKLDDSLPDLKGDYSKFKTRADMPSSKNQVWHATSENSNEGEKSL